MRPSSILHPLIILIVAVIVAGCGGGGVNGPTSGSATFTVDWPTRSRVLPKNAECVEIVLSGVQGLPAPVVLNRTEQAGTQPITFPNLPLGTLTYSITAYPLADKGGIPVGEATGIISITGNSPALVTVSAVMRSTISSIAVATATGASSVNTGETLSLVATASDSQGRVVLTPPGNLTWRSEDESKAKLITDEVVLGTGAGNVNLIASESDSGLHQSITLAVNGPKVVQNSTTSLNASGGTIQVPTVTDSPTVSLPAGAITGEATVISSAMETSPTPPGNSDAVLVGNPIKTVISGSDLVDGTEATVTAPVTAGANEQLVIGYEQDGVWVAMPAEEATRSGGNVSAHLPIMTSDTTRSRGTRGISQRVIVWGIYKFICNPKTGDPPMETYQFNGSGWNVYNGNWKETQGERVALMVHGVWSGTHTDFTPLASHLMSKGYYDEIYAVEYHEGYGINRIGSKLATYISSKVFNGVGKIDVFAHSMGGVVAREAIERPNGAASKVNLLATMSSPHNGQSKALLFSIILNGVRRIGINVSLTDCVPEFADLSAGSPYFSGLNSPTHTNCIYRSLIGADANQNNKYWPVPLNFFNLLLAYDHDGMVEVNSSSYPLSGECASYKSATLRLNHDWIKRSDSSFNIIDGWLNELYPPSVQLTTDRATITIGESTTLRWTSTNATRVEVSNFGAGSANGQMTVSPSTTTTYGIAVAGPAGISQTSQITITVSSAPPPPQTSKCYGWCGQDVLSVGTWVTIQNTGSYGLKIKDSPAGNTTGYLWDGNIVQILEGPVNVTVNGQNLSMYRHSGNGWSGHCQVFNGNPYIYMR